MMEFEKNVRWLTPRYATILQPAEAGFVCVDAVSTAGDLIDSSTRSRRVSVCVDAVSTAGDLIDSSTRSRRVSVCVDAVSNRRGFDRFFNPLPSRECLCRRGF